MFIHQPLQARVSLASAVFREAPSVDGLACLTWFLRSRYADKLDVWCVVVGSLGAAASGAALPVFAYLFGKIVNNIGQLSGNDLISNVNQTVLYFVYLAIATFVASYLEMSLWMLSGTYSAYAHALPLEAFLSVH